MTKPMPYPAATPTPTPTTTPNEDSTMLTITTDTKTLINGQDAAGMTDDQLFSVIAKAEAEIDQLMAIRNKPEKLKQRVVTLTEAVETLVKYIDQR